MYNSISIVYAHCFLSEKNTKQSTEQKKAQQCGSDFLLPDTLKELIETGLQILSKPVALRLLYAYCYKIEFIAYFSRIRNCIAWRKELGLKKDLSSIAFLKKD